MNSFHFLLILLQQVTLYLLDYLLIIWLLETTCVRLEWMLLLGFLEVLDLGLQDFDLVLVGADLVQEGFVLGL